jgi:uncharacterized protein YoxC
MLGAVGRWIKSISYLLTGRMDAARKALDTNPHVVRAKYDEVIKEKTSRMHQYKSAVAGLIAQQEKKMAKTETLTEDVKRLEQLKAGALAKAKERVATLQKNGADKAAIQGDEEYQKCLGAYNDFSSTLQEKQDHILDLENDVEEYTVRIKEHKVQLQQLQRDLEKVKMESKEAVADIISSQHEKELADMISGISDDKTANKLNELREVRSEAKAEARISKELAGTDSAAQEADFLEYARTNTANDEFASLVGLADDVAAAPADSAPAATEKLPE